MNYPEISIGILSNKEIRFDLYGEFFENTTNKGLSGNFLATLNNNKIILTQNSREIFSSEEIILTPKDIEEESFVLYDVIIGKQFHWERKEKQRFRGTLKIIIDENNLTAINIIPLDEYLVSVISSEMSANCSIELLKAHAIISRSWVLAQLEKTKNFSSINEVITENEIIRWYHRNDHTKYDFCADDHCQRYQGITKILNEKAYEAVDMTRGLVLMYDNKICDTRYSKCCGGITESYENVWEPVRYHYLVPVLDYKFEVEGLDYDLTKEENFEHWIKSSPHAFCNTTNKKILSQILNQFDIQENISSEQNYYRWKIEYSQDEISDIILSKSGIDFGNIVDLIPIERGYSGRIIRLKIIGTKKTLTIGKELEIRKTLSKTHLYSSAFITKKENIIGNIPSKFILYGCGWGHGVGLCQIGAAVMGEMGYLFDEILSHYYKGAKIHKIY
ncbi:MAG: SpoIID/LytB domain-containing protein [Melioribacter sp.]|uniref:SpoIID/LytB domain-containing protein n=1 Tax=Rosettibacter primus TaxID=3111523 RepID=UPI00247C1385|nr:SpoIID/LytB domain-containing protein [Melioribacter sp.]